MDYLQNWLFPCRPILQIIRSLLYSSFINNYFAVKFNSTEWPNVGYSTHSGSLGAHALQKLVSLHRCSCYSGSYLLHFINVYENWLDEQANECDVVALTRESGARQSLYRRDEDLRWSLSSVWCWSMCSNSCSSTRDTRTWCRTSKTSPSSTSSTEKGKLITSSSVGLEIDFL